MQGECVCFLMLAHAQPADQMVSPQESEHIADSWLYPPCFLMLTSSITTCSRDWRWKLFHAAVSVDINCPLQAQWTTPQAFKFDIWLLHFSFLQELQKYNFGHFGKRWQLFQAYSTPAISASPLQLLDMFQLKPNPVSLPYKIILFS